MGHPLSQTLFTSLYLDKLLWPVPKSLEEAHFFRGHFANNNEELEIVHLVLRAYCLALIKCCDFVHARVATEYYFEVSINTPYSISMSTTNVSFHLRKRISSPSSITVRYCHSLNQSPSTTFSIERSLGLTSKRTSWMRTCGKLYGPDCCSDATFYRAWSKMSK